MCSFLDCYDPPRLDRSRTVLYWFILSGGGLSRKTAALAPLSRSINSVYIVSAGPDSIFCFYYSILLPLHWGGPLYGVARYYVLQGFKRRLFDSSGTLFLMCFPAAQPDPNCCNRFPRPLLFAARWPPCLFPAAPLHYGTLSRCFVVSLNFLRLPENF